MKLKWGYFPSPFDPEILLPDPKKLDALFYAFKMKSRYGTSFRDCAMWVHAATGAKINIRSFEVKYNDWKKSIRKLHAKELIRKKDAISRKNQKFIDEHLKDLGVNINVGSDDIAALAAKLAREAWKKKESRIREYRAEQSSAAASS